MARILQSLLALIGLLALAFLAARADSAEWSDTGTNVQPAPAEAAVAHRAPRHRCFVPGPQPGTHLQGQPFAYGNFGAHPQSTAVFHVNSRNDWYQWSFYRAD